MISWIICAVLAIVVFWVVFVLDNRIGTSIDKWQTGHLLAVVLISFAGGPGSLLLSLLFAVVFGICLIVKALEKVSTLTDFWDKDL